jgi:hypothetical protein
MRDLYTTTTKKLVASTSRDSRDTAELPTQPTSKITVTSLGFTPQQNKGTLEASVTGCVDIFQAILRYTVVQYNRMGRRGAWFVSSR